MQTYETFEEYSQAAAVFAVESVMGDAALTYGVLGLSSEAGEVAGKIKKAMRGDSDLDTQALAQELGDCLWYINHIALAIGVPLGDIALLNLAKLAQRQLDGTIRGSGDDRVASEQERHEINCGDDGWGSIDSEADE